MRGPILCIAPGKRTESCGLRDGEIYKCDSQRWERRRRGPPSTFHVVGNSSPCHTPLSFMQNRPSGDFLQRHVSSEGLGQVWLGGNMRQQFSAYRRPTSRELPDVVVLWTFVGFA